MALKNIDRYEIIQEIGRGGMATVYEANDPRFDRIVAVKVLPREFMHDPEFRGRFTREAKTIAALEHPAIVPVYDFGQEDGQPFLVMRLMRGGSLTEKMLAGPISIEETSQILKRIGSALDRAHKMGIVHRDMKPSNILFDEYGEAYLADFGIVQVSTSADALTASGSLVGTPAYMSPEQVYGDKKLDGRSDIYALGVILFQMLTGTPPYTADTPARMMMKHVMDPVPQVLQMRPDLPNELDSIINRAMAKERNERFSQASELSSALTAVTTKQERPNQIQSELAAIREEIAQERIEQEKQSEAKTQTEVLPDQVIPLSNPEIETKSPGLNIPRWVYGLVGLLAIICFGITGALLFASNQRQNTENATSTAVAIADVTKSAESALATADQATIDAIPPTETPTNTPEPTSTFTPTPSIDLTATQESIVSTKAANEAEATRLSLIETRTAEATVESVAPPVLLLNDDKTTLFGPADGTLLHETNNLIKSDYADISIQNFLLQATFVAPYETAVAGWDFGVTFRQQAANDELRLVVRSDGAWNLNNRSSDDDNFIQEGDLSNSLTLGKGSTNSILILAVDETGYFFLNGEFIESLDLSSKLAEGDIGLGTGYYTNNQVDGESTDYESFAVWPIEDAFGPENGVLEHIDDGFIKTVSTEINSKNFIATADFINPYGPEVGVWDYGFSFRDVELGEQYWFVMDSEGLWDLINRVENDDQYLQNDAVKGIDTAVNGRNRITLIALEDIGIVYINDQFITELNLADRSNTGEIKLVTAFFADHEVPGNSTGYENFTVWPLP